MPAKVKCPYCMGVRKILLTDDNDRPTGEWEWWSDCELFGNEEVVGQDCGKGHCYKYPRRSKKDAGGAQ